MLENDEFKLRLKPLLHQRRNSVTEKGFITAGFLEHFSKEEDKWLRSGQTKTRKSLVDNLAFRVSAALTTRDTREASA